jgi:hypothetical protein
MSTALEALDIMAATQKAIRRADQLIELVSTKAEASSLSVLVKPTLLLKERLEAEMDELQKIIDDQGL